MTLVSSSPPLKLIDLCLKPSGSIISSLVGEFTSSGCHEIAMIRPGGIIELHRLSDESTLKLVSRIETWSVLRCISSIRLAGLKRDLLAIGSDSGCLCVIDFESNETFTAPKIHVPTPFGKTQCRRGVPGQYITSDPRGRAVMIASVEKRKLVYVLNRDSSDSLTIASPLEAHRNRTLCWGVVGVDNGYENPIFASLEILYADELDSQDYKKEIAYYELDLGLNHVSRKWSTNIASTACCIASLPGGSDGPSGILIGCENYIEYIHDNLTERIVCLVPRRNNMEPNQSVLVQSITVFKQKRNKFFALAQTELGDVFKVLFQNNILTISLLDTLQVGNSLNITKAGYLFVASEFGDHNLYRFERIDLEDSATMTSKETHSICYDSGNPIPQCEEEQDIDLLPSLNKYISDKCSKFEPSKLKNLKKESFLESLAPTVQVLVGELAGNEVSPQIYTLCGRGPDSSLKILRHGAAVTELAVSDLPGTPGAVFTVKGHETGYDKYIVVSFADATLVLSVGETVEEVSEGSSGFLTNAPTLACSALSQERGICQVHPGGVRHIHQGRAKQWHCPGLKRIEMASANESQVLIALAGGEIIYFELDVVSGNLTEASTREMGVDVSCLDVGSIPEKRTRSVFAAVGCLDQSVRIISLMTDSLLIQRSSTALRARPHSVCLQQPCYLNIGLEDGSFLKNELDEVTGTIRASPLKRFLGARPVGTARVQVNNQSCTFLLSSRPWISRPDPASQSGKYLTTPLSYIPLDHACRFSSEAVPEGIVATAGSTLRILMLEGREADAFNSHSVKLRYTPRQMCLLEHSQLVIVESDINALSVQKSTVVKDTMDMDMDDDDDDDAPSPPPQEQKEESTAEDDEENFARSTVIRGPVPSKQGTWASSIRLLDPSNKCTTLDLIELTQNEAALCCCSVRFHSRGNEPLLAVGTVSNMVLHPLKCTEAHVVLYRVLQGDRLQLLHRTKVEAPVLCLTHFCGRLLVGVGKVLRLYEMGKKQLLRKCEYRSFPFMIKTLQAAGDRAYVGDMMQSVHFLKYDSTQNRIILLANDRVPSRCITCQELLDRSTIAAADKFGNIFIFRLPKGSEAGVVNLSGTRALWESSRADDLIPKLEILCHYYVGEVVTSLTRASLVAGSSEALLYVTITGRLGALLPLMTSKEDIEFYKQLENFMRVHAPRVTGREPQAYRSFYAPAKHVIDGDLCESFLKVELNLQKLVAEKMDRNIGEIFKKLEDTRNALL